MLPLTPFEEYMFLDGTDTFPMNCFVNMQFSGRFQRSRLEAAWATALAKHPLLLCRIVEQRQGQFAWVREPALPEPRWLEEHVPQGRPIYLRTEAPIRLSIVERQSDTGPKSELHFEVHHSVADAAGMFWFLEQFLYDYHLGETAVDERTVEEAIKILGERGNFQSDYRKVFRNIPKQLFGFFRAWMFLVHRPIPIVPHHPPTGRMEHPDYPALLSRTFDTETTNAVLASGKRRAVSFNDMLLAAMYRGVDRWRNDLEIEPDNRFIRVAVPTNLRRPDELPLSACNRVSMVFLDRRHRQCDDPKKLLEGIHREMSHIKRNELGWAFIFGLAFFKHYLGGLQGMIDDKRCWSSMVLTNLGRVFADSALPKIDGKIRIDGEEDELILESLSASPPIRPWTTASLGAVNYAGELSLQLHYDPRILVRKDATALLDRICTSLIDDYCSET
jgi:NRPS condensation-like uncharacterized protein